MRLELAVVLSVFCASATAQLREIGDYAGGKLFADPSSISRRGDSVVMRVISNRPKDEHVIAPGGGWAKSQTINMQFDCKRKRYRVGEQRYYSELLGLGTLLGTQEDDAALWLELNHPTNELLWRYACGKGVLL